MQELSQHEIIGVLNSLITRPCFFKFLMMNTSFPRNQTLVNIFPSIFTKLKKKNRITEKGSRNEFFFLPANTKNINVNGG